jgi:hypothetical protein
MRRGVIVLVVTFLFFHFLYPRLFANVGEGGISLTIDAEISAGTAIEAYFNSDWTHPVSTQIKPGKRVKYKLSYRGISRLRPKALESIRVDVTDAPNAVVTIYSISVKDGSEKAKMTGSQLFASASLSGLEAVKQVGNAGTFRASTNDPFLFLAPKLAVSSESITQSILRLVRDYLLLAGSLLCLLVISALEFTSRHVPMRHRLVLTLSPWILLGIPWLIYSLGIDSLVSPKFQSIALAVGNSTFGGYPKASEFSQVYWCMGIALALGLFVAMLSGKALRMRQVAHAEQDLSLRQNIGNGWWWKASVIALIGVLCVRDMGAAYSSLSDRALPLDYDSLNIETWNYLWQEGFLPFKDFWFPYGFSIFAMGRSPMAMVAMLGHTVLIYVVLASCLYRLLGRQRAWALSTVVLLLFLDISGLVRGTYRYFICLDLVLFFSVIVLCSPRTLVGVLFGIFGAYCSIFEPSQALYALPAFLVLLVYSVVSRRWLRFVSEVCKPLGAGLISGCAILIAFLCYINATDQADGLVRLYSRLGSSAISSSVAGNISAWLSNPITLEGGVLGGSLIIMAWGVFCASSLSTGPRRDVAVVALAVGTASMCIFGKHLIRPHMANQFIAFVLVGAVLILWVVRHGWTRSQVLALYAWLGMILYISTSSAGAGDVQRIVTAAPKNLLEGLQLTSLPRNSGRESYRYFFSEERLLKVYPVIDELHRLLEMTAATKGSRTFFVLGDEAFLYNVFRQKPPPFISFYNSSDVRDQIDIVNWLEAEKPSVVVWNTSSQSFDGVPNVVRVPLIFKHVFAQYRKVGVFGDYWFLERLDTPSSDATPWREVLGSELNLGFLPNLSSIGSYPTCVLGNRGMGCEPVIHITRDGSIANNKVEPGRNTSFTITVRQKDMEYAAVIPALASQSDLYVRADRLWFVSDESGPIVADLIQPVKGVSVVVEGRVLPETLLY